MPTVFALAAMSLNLKKRIESAWLGYIASLAGTRILNLKKRIESAKWALPCHFWYSAIESQEED